MTAYWTITHDFTQFDRDLISMFANLFATKPVLDEASVQWIFETYAWALRNFEAEVFRDETILVTPSNEHFPGRETSVHGMATLIFEQVKTYAGMQHWPFRLATDAACALPAPHKIVIQGALRGSKGKAPADIDAEHQILVNYDPQLVANPEAMIAGFAHTLAHHLGAVAQEPPPGGVQNWPHLTEILAVFLGFGLMFANSAFNFRPSSCGSCGGRTAQRQNFLSQYDITYALALFCVLKNIPNKDVTRNLKASLRSYYRKAVKDIRGRDQALEKLTTVVDGNMRRIAPGATSVAQA
jgi:hypothetical protein